MKVGRRLWIPTNSAPFYPKLQNHSWEIQGFINRKNYEFSTGKAFDPACAASYRERIAEIGLELGYYAGTTT